MSGLRSPFDGFAIVDGPTRVIENHWEGSPILGGVMIAQQNASLSFLDTRRSASFSSNSIRRYSAYHIVLGLYISFLSSSVGLPRRLQTTRSPSFYNQIQSKAFSNDTCTTPHSPLYLRPHRHGIHVAQTRSLPHPLPRTSPRRPNMGLLPTDLVLQLPRLALTLLRRPQNPRIRPHDVGRAAP